MMMNNNNDIIRNTLIGLESAIPTVGSPIAIILDKILPSNLMKRYDAFIEELDKEIKRMHIVVDSSLYDSEDFLPLFQATLEKAICEHEHEKVTAFKNILLNSMIIKHKLDRSLFFVRLTSLFTADQIRFISMCRNKHLDLAEVKKLSPSVDENYIICSITELIRYRLLHGSTLTELGKEYLKYIETPKELKD